jgi:hypothetical protein
MPADHDSYMREIYSPEAKQNLKKFWSFLKGKKQKAFRMTPLRNTDDLMHSDSGTKTNIFNVQFKSVFTKGGLSSRTKKAPAPTTIWNPLPSLHQAWKNCCKIVSPIKPLDQTELLLDF